MPLEIVLALQATRRPRRSAQPLGLNHLRATGADHLAGEDQLRLGALPLAMVRHRYLVQERFLRLRPIAFVHHSNPSANTVTHGRGMTTARLSTS